MSPLALGGLASGIDTDSIIKQLMAVEGQSKTRLQLADTRANARQTGLRDLATKLGAAARRRQRTEEHDDVVRRPAARLQRSGAGRHARDCRRRARPRAHRGHRAGRDRPARLHVHGERVAADDHDRRLLARRRPDSTISTVAAAINDREDSPVTAVVAGGKLVLTSRTGGEDGDFSVDATPLLAEDAVYARVGLRRRLPARRRPEDLASNVITDAILGVELTLKATTTSPVSLTVSDPAPDTDGVKAKVTAFVSAYNSAVDFIRGKLSEEKVKNPTTTAEASKGLFRGDTMLTGVLSSMRSQIGDLSAYGISTGAASGSATFSPTPSPAS